MLEIVVWDVEHGSAVYVNTPSGRHIAIDLGASGKNGSNFSPLQTLRYSRKVQRLDAVVVTHGHRDHVDDILNLYALSPSVLYTPRHLSDLEIRESNPTANMTCVEHYLALRSAYSFPVPSGSGIEPSPNFDDFNFQLFSPLRCSHANLNDHSLVAVLSYAGSKIVIPGDNESASWQELLEDAAFRNAISGTDVLIASHHGRESGYCSELFEVMGEPKLVVISDGEFCDTSVTSKYYSKASGWDVFDPYGGQQKRYTLTTRKDGHVTIKFGWNLHSDGRYLNVTTSKQMEPGFLSILAALNYGSGPLRS